MVDEIRFSDAVGDVCCERCHCAASPPASAAARYYKPPPSPPAPKPSPYARLHTRVWDRLKQEGDVFTLADGTGQLYGWCPVCSRGTIAVRLIDTDPPRLRLDECSDGCPPRLIAARLR